MNICVDFFACHAFSHCQEVEDLPEAHAAGSRSRSCSLASPQRGSCLSQDASPVRVAAKPSGGTLLGRPTSVECLKHDGELLLAEVATPTPSCVDGCGQAFLLGASPGPSPSNPSEAEDVWGIVEKIRVPSIRAALPAKDLAAVEALEAELGAAGLAEVRAMLVQGEALESCLMRFLNNNHMKIRSAAKAIHAVLSWRGAERPDLLADRDIGDIAGCSEELLNQYMPTWHQGTDKRGRPVVFSHYGKFRFAPVLEAGVTVEKILQLHVRNSECTARLCGEQSAKLGVDISNSLIILDTAGWDNNNLKTKAAFDWARGIAKIDGEYYPERMGQMFVINAPPSVNYFYKLVSWFLPEKARNKVKIFAGREQWEPALLELVHASQLPPEYGGCGAPPPGGP